jgi:TolB-like protein/Tfp pilus assembly protein PilF
VGPLSRPGSLEIGDWLVDPELCRISRGGCAIHLRPKLMDLLVFLASNQGRVVSKDEILERVWPDQFVVESVLGRSIADLRHLLEDDAGSPRFIETIARRGYRLIAPVSRHRAPASEPSIVVLPFIDLTPQGEHQYFCDGLAEELTSTLSNVPGLRVIARTSAFSFRNQPIDVREIGRRLGVGSVLEGSVQRAEGRLRITLQLIDTADGSHLWSRRFDRAPGDVFSIEDEVAEAAAAALKVTLLQMGDRRLARGRTMDPEAHDFYLKGLYIGAKRTPEALAEAIDCFRAAIAKDPRYAIAHAALAQCLGVSAFLGYQAASEASPKAASSARRAVEIEPALAEGHAVLASVAAFYAWQWDDAERGFQRAIALSPSYALAYMWYSQMLAAVGRTDEALDRVEAALALDPLSLNVRVSVGLRVSEAHQVERGVAQLLGVLDLDPAFSLAHFHIGRIYVALGRYVEALEHLRRVASGSPLASGLIGFALARLGRREEAQQVLAGLRSLAATQQLGAEPVAFVLQGMGEIDTALEWYRRAIDAHEGVVAMLGVELVVDELRSDPRFAALLERLHLPG